MKLVEAKTVNIRVSKKTPSMEYIIRKLVVQRKSDMRWEPIGYGQRTLNDRRGMYLSGHWLLVMDN